MNFYTCFMSSGSFIRSASKGLVGSCPSKYIQKLFFMFIILLIIRFISAIENKWKFGVATGRHD